MGLGLAGERGRTWRGVFAVALVGVLVLALKPGTATPELFPEADKVRHLAAFIVLWLIGARARVMPAWALALGLLGFGLGIELLQSFTPTRQASFADLLADAVGIGLGWLLHRREQALARVPSQAGELKPPAT